MQMTIYNMYKIKTKAIYKTRADMYIRCRMLSANVKNSRGGEEKRPIEKGGFSVSRFNHHAARGSEQSGG